MLLEILAQTSIAGRPVRPGDVVEAADRDARYLVLRGKAREALAPVAEAPAAQGPEARELEQSTPAEVPAPEARKPRLRKPRTP
jgi:hypothetical protein